MNGYQSYERTTNWMIHVHQWTWWDPEYKGRWYVYAKTFKGKKRADGGGYHFQMSKPSKAIKHGWVAPGG